MLDASEMGIRQIICQSELSSDSKKISPFQILKQVQNDINENLSYIF